MGGSDSDFAYRLLIFAMVIMVALPIMINNFVPQQAINIDEDELLEDYYEFTGSSRGPTKEAVWVLTGIYTPYAGGNYGYTDDGWLYGSRIQENTPEQYGPGSPQNFTVYRDENGIYRYKFDTADYNKDEGTGHKGSFRYATEEDHEKDEDIAVGSIIEQDTLGDIYTHVTFDKSKMSNIFFTKNGKHGENGELFDNTVNSKYFYYEYTGYRYAFQPPSDSWTSDGQGNKIALTATTTSLSLIWYQYYTQTGISGQLVLSGNDSGVAYINGDQIVRAFDSTTNTARFAMTFNGGVEMGVYVKIDPYATVTLGMTVQQAYNEGYWSIMVTSLSTDPNAYIGTDFSLDIEKILMTIVDLLTFNYTKYNMSDMMGMICSFIIVIPLYAGLIAIAINHWQALIITGVLLIIQSIATMMSNWGSWF